jgi:hypothetical protein
MTLKAFLIRTCKSGALEFVLVLAHVERLVGSIQAMFHAIASVLEQDANIIAAANLLGQVELHICLSAAAYIRDTGAKLLILVTFMWAIKITVAGQVDSNAIHSIPAQKVLLAVQAFLSL